MDRSEYIQELAKLGKRIRQLRKHRKLTLLELEMLSGINDSDLSRYEQGKENLEFFTICKIAKALGVTVNALTDFNGPLPDNNNFKAYSKNKSSKSVKPKSTPKKRKLKG